MQIGVVGDSHSVFCFSEIAEARIFWRGPMLMHRVGRDGVKAILPRRINLPDFSAMIFVFGEIDCRAHISGIAGRTAQPIAAVIEDLAERYVAALQVFRQEFHRPIAIMGVVPPVAAMLPNEGTETLAEVCQRQVGIRRQLNERLREHCKTHGFSFVDVYDEYSLPDGSLDLTLSDGNLHIAPDKTRAVREATATSLGVKLTYRPLDRDVFLIPVGNYWRRKRELLDAWMKQRWRTTVARS